MKSINNRIVGAALLERCCKAPISVLFVFVFCITGIRVVCHPLDTGYKREISLESRPLPVDMAAGATSNSVAQAARVHAWEVQSFKPEQRLWGRRKFILL